MLSFGRGALLSLLWGHGVQAACTDTCGDMAPDLKKDMNDIACAGLSNYPHKELDGCRKGFNVAKNMGCFFACEAKDEGSALAPSGDGVPVASRTAACKAVGKGAKEVAVSELLVQKCYIGYDWSLAQYMLTNPTKMVGDGYVFDPNAWTYAIKFHEAAGSKLKSLFTCAQGAALAPQLVGCMNTMQAPFIWLGPRKVIGGTHVVLSPSFAGRNCVVASFGLEKDVAFENGLLAQTHCKVFMFDPRPNAAPPVHSSGRQFFDKTGLATAKAAASMTTTETRDVGYDTFPASYQSFADALAKHNLTAADISLVKLDTGGYSRNALFEVLETGIPNVLVHVYGSDPRRFAWVLSKILNMGYVITRAPVAEERAYDWQEVGAIATYEKGYRVELELFKSPNAVVAEEPAAMVPANKLVTAAVVKQAMNKLGNKLMVPGVLPAAT